MMSKMKTMCALHKAAWVLVLVGAVNWGLVGALKFNLVNSLLGAWPSVERVVYVLVGAAAIMMLAAGKCCMKCEACGAGGAPMEKPPMGGAPKA